MAKKKKTENPTASGSVPLDDLGIVRKIRIHDDDFLMDKLDDELLDACAEWINREDLQHGFFLEEGEPCSLFAHLRTEVIALVDNLRKRWNASGWYVIDGIDGGAE